MGVGCQLFVVCCFLQLTTNNRQQTLCMTDSRKECIESSIIRTIVFFDVLEYAPTWTECSAWLEWDGGGGIERQSLPSVDELIECRDELVARGVIEFAFDRVAPRGRLAHLATQLADRMPLMARKLAHARKAVRWMLRSGSVRFIALVNTTALGIAGHGSDLDFFVVVKHGSIWTTRLLSGFPYRISGKLSGVNAIPDAVCLSYFISDEHLDLSPHMLLPDDPYYRYWFCAMLPLYDDGVSVELWEQNRELIKLHPFASKWEIAPDLAVRRPLIRYHAVPGFEALARHVQIGWFPSKILDRMNRDTSVIVNDHVLKFHVDDGREAYRSRYLERLKQSLAS